MNATLADHHPLGASTGFHSEWRGDWQALLSLVTETSSFSAELAALSEPELEGLRNFLAHRAAFPFRYLSVHAPVKNREARDTTLIAWLADLPGYVAAIVTHPDTIEDWSAYGALAQRLVIENMDSRKAYGRTPDEMERVFDELPAAGFCLDIAHAWSVDPTMKLAHEMLDRFRVRLRHVHLSSLENGRHVPLKPDHEKLFKPVLDRCRDVPWILEAERPSHW